MFGRSKLEMKIRASSSCEAADDLVARLRIGGGGERDARHVRESARAAPRAAGIRGGSRAPIARRNAPRRSRTARAGACVARRFEHARHHQPLGRDVQEIELARAQRALHVRSASLRVERRVEEGRAHAELLQRGHLVLHERDERRDHQRRALAQEGGHLVAERLAAAGGHQHQRVAAARHVLDDRLLRAAKLRMSENARQHVKRRGGGSLRGHAPDSVTRAEGASQASLRPVPRAAGRSPPSAAPPCLPRRFRCGRHPSAPPSRPG